VKEQTASATRRLKSFAGEFDRLSSLTMAAGKDFNDELTFILNYAEVSLDLLGPEHPASDGIGRVDARCHALRGDYPLPVAADGSARERRSATLK
jgi:hypothetical protein